MIFDFKGSTDDHGFTSGCFLDVSDDFVLDEVAVSIREPDEFRRVDLDLIEHVGRVFMFSCVVLSGRVVSFDDIQGLPADVDCGGCGGCRAVDTDD